MTRASDQKDATLQVLLDAFETIDEGIAIYDANERLVHCNQLYKDNLGPVAHLVEPGMDWRKFMRAYIDAGMAAANYDPKEDFDVQADRLRSEAVRRKGEVTADGRHFEIAYAPMPNGGFVLTRKDVTEISRAAADAAHHSALLTRILETNPIPVVMARLSDSKIVWRSPAALELVGHAEYAIDHFYDPDRRKDYVALLQEHGKVEDFRTLCRAANGAVISVALSGTLTEFEGDTCVVSSITDLTEVLEREALLRQVIEACPAPVLMNRAESGEILYRSPELRALLGDGFDATQFYVDPRERAGFLQALRATGEVNEYRVRLLNASGKPFWAAVSGRVTEWNGEEVLVTHTRDLTQQLGMEAELDRQREQTFQNEKMSALGGLLAGVAHELNNPLSVVVGHAMMLQEEAGDENTLRQTRKISEAAERCARIVKTFLSMARQEPARLEPVDLNEIAQIAVDVARYGDDAHAVRIEQSFDDAVPQINGDGDQLTQVAINLILNAEQAIAASGVGDVIRLTTSQGKDSVILTVEDNGPGVPADIRKRIFDPFFTTKGVGQGTGIGLSMCHRIVTAHGGRIGVDDVEGGGARFIVTLPEMSAADDVTDDSTAEDPPKSTICRVLVIDDEEDVADLNAEVLKRAGCDASAVFSVDAGLDLLKSQDFDVVISDLNMPGKDGRALFEVIKAEHPDLASGVGFITGDTLGRTSQAFLAEADRPFLEKPVSPRELRDFVARLCQDCRT